MTTNREEIEAWVRQVAPELAKSRLGQIDIDELLDPAPAKAVAIGLEVVQLMGQVLRALDRSDDVMLIIPLPVSLELDRDHPTFSHLVADDWAYGPGHEVPGFYLMPLALWRLHEDREEYRRAITSDLVPPGLKAYYQTWRTVDEEARGWEYARQVNVRTV